MVDVADAEGVLDGGHLVAFHGRLKGVDGVDFGDDDAGAEAAQRLRRALAHIAVTADDGHFTGHHHVGGALDSVGERLAAAVEVVELRLGDRVVDIDGGNEQLAVLLHLVKAMNARGGLFGDAAPLLHEAVPELRILSVDALEKVLDHLLFVAFRGAVDPVAALFEFIAFVDKQRDVAAVVDDELRTFAIGVADRLQRAVPVFLEGFTLPGKDGNAGGGDGGGSVVLGGEDVAACPADGGAEVDQGFNQNRGLNGHVQRTGDADSGERLFLGVLVADGHQARHLVLGDGNFFPAPVGQLHVGHLEFGADRFRENGAHGCVLTPGPG